MIGLWLANKQLGSQILAGRVVLIVYRYTFFSNEYTNACNKMCPNVYVCVHVVFIYT